MINVARPDVSVNSTSPLLSVRALTTDILTTTGPERLLDDVSFWVNQGELLAIVGESGSGKSMAMLALVGLLAQPALVVSGGAMFEGHDLLRMPAGALRRLRGDRIGMIFQEPMSALNPLLCVGDQIAETLVTHRRLDWRDARAQSVRLLDRVRIAGASRVARMRPHQLSGGMRQRVVIAAAIACKPSLLIPDEPTTALDATVQAEIMDLLRELRRDVGCAVILITHDMGLVADSADRACVMLKGRIVESSPVATMLSEPRETYTKTLVAASSPSHSGLLRPPNATAPALLAVRDVCVGFPAPGGGFGLGASRQIFAVDGVTFELGPSETLAIVGESGSGKTTLARAILGLVPIAGGAVTLSGVDSWERPARARSEMQCVFQDPLASLDPQFRAWRSVTEPLRLAGMSEPAEARARAETFLLSVGLGPEYLDRLPHEMSGGQRQRVGVARALATDPKLLVADEPVSALDATTRLQVLALFIELQEKRKLAYLFITHDLAVVTRIAHRVAVMRFGRLV